MNRAHHFLLRRPDIAQKYRASFVVGTERFRVQIDVHLTGEGVRNDKRRRSEIIRTDKRIDSSFEIAISAKNGRDDEAVLFYRGADRFRERAAVTDASRTAIADNVETQTFEVRHQTGIFEVVGYNPGSGREARFDPRLHPESPLDRLFRQKSRGDHHRWV